MNTTTTTTYAHYYTGRSNGQRRSYVLITEDVRPVNGTRYNVSGKREAREIAARLNAQPWNF